MGMVPCALLHLIPLFYSLGGFEDQVPWKKFLVLACSSIAPVSCAVVLHYFNLSQNMYVYVYMYQRVR